MLTRVSTYANHQRTLRDVSRVQSDLASSQRQISSGKKADVFADLAGQVEFYTSLTTKMGRAEKYQDQNDVIIGRLETMNGVVKDVIEAATEMRNLVVTRRNGGVKGEALLTQTSRVIAEKIGSGLNTNIEGRYLFAGGKTDTPPVDVSIQTLSIGVPDDGYYKGDNAVLSTKASDSLQVDYGVRANESGFQKVLAAIQLAQSGDAVDSDAQLAQAQDLLTDAIDEITAIQGRINANVTTLKDTNALHQAQELYWKGLSEEIGNADTVALASKVAVDQTVLQGTYQVFSLISSLSILDYLR